VLGRKARRVSAQNIVFSLATMIPFAVSGVIGVAVMVLVHEASELLAVVNGLRRGPINLTTLCKRACGNLPH
jgi:Cd2+/Zn2+-exporting ATPase